MQPLKREGMEHVSGYAADAGGIKEGGPQQQKPNGSSIGRCQPRAAAGRAAPT